MRKSTTKASSLLASFATLKSLSDAKKYQSPYQILAEFVKYIIVTESLYTFSAVMMKTYLHDYFDFEIPEAVIKTTAKKMAGITAEDGIYTVAPSTVKVDLLFEEKQKEADKYSSEIIEALAKYIQERTGEVSINVNYLTQSLISFLVDDHSLNSAKYTDLISEFIVKNEKDEAIQKGLNQIREGSILYIGLNYNIGETGSIKRPLTLYLGTEILFSLAGYNGEIRKELAQDFFGQVQLANSGKQKKITLRYFSDTKKEMDDFFFVAQDVADGKTALPIGKPAMAAITNGCATSADVAIKKADFYYILKHTYGIAEDTKTDYYGEAYFTTNLESFDYVDDDDKKKKRETSIKQISHINKLREGKHFLNDIDSGYLIVTNTKATLMISREQVDLIKAETGMDSVSNFAVSLDRITSLLWYKLGGDFGQKSYPRNVNAVLKARVVLSSSIAKKAEKSFAEIKMQYESGTISEDQVAARIITLRDKPNLPEEVQGDDIAETMDFSPAFLSKYEERVKQDRNNLEEKEKLIEALKVENAQKLSERDATIASQVDTIRGKEDENADLRAQLNEYQRKESQANQRKLFWKNIALFTWSIIWKISIVAAISMAIMWCEKHFDSDLPPLIFAIIDAIGLVVVAWSTVKVAKEKYFPSKKVKESS